MELKERVKLLFECSKNKSLQEIEIELCKRSPIYFFETYLYTEKNKTFIDMNAPNDVPFILFEYQKEFINEVWESIVE